MANHQLPSPDILRQLLSYDPETGKLMWLKRPADMFPSGRIAASWNARLAGKEAFTATTGGYFVGGIFGKLADSPPDRLLRPFAIPHIMNECRQRSILMVRDFHRVVRYFIRDSDNVIHFQPLPQPHIRLALSCVGLIRPASFCSPQALAALGDC